MFRRFLASIVIATALSSSASAQANITVVGFVPENGVHLTTFQVTGAGTFDIWTTPVTFPNGATPFDAYLRLFAGTSTLVPPLLQDDDQCESFLSQCGDATPFDNALLNNVFLGVGTYTVEVSSIFPELFGDYALRIASLEEFGGGDGEAFVEGITTVPEPGSLVLVAGGLLGLAALRRKRA